MEADLETKVVQCLTAWRRLLEFDETIGHTTIKVPTSAVPRLLDAIDLVWQLHQPVLRRYSHTAKCAECNTILGGPVDWPYPTSRCLTTIASNAPGD